MKKIRFLSAILFILVAGLTLIFSCNKKEELNERHTPVIITSEVTDIKDNTAKCRGEVLFNGVMKISERGIIWSLTPDPLTATNKKPAGEGTGLFECDLKDLEFDKTYYVWAYAVNDAGSWFGNKVEFTTFIGQANLITIPGDNITTHSVETGGNITYDGGGNIIERGVCWSLFSDPTYADPHTSDGTGSGKFTSTIDGLQAQTEYFIRAYAKNHAGIWYGDQISIYTFNKNIGDQFEGGKIAYIYQPDDPGFVYGETHGLIAALHDQHHGVQWYNGTYEITGADGHELTDGLPNTDDIVNTQLYGYYAARICDTVIIDGHDDWVLPSNAELEQLYINKDKIGNFFIYSNYWSSTEFDDGNAYALLFTTGFIGSSNKAATWRVRAIRYF